MNLHSLNTDVRAAEDDRMLEAAKNVIAFAAAHGYRISSCESFTAGLFCAVLGSVPGASSVLAGGFVTYQSYVKTIAAHVGTELIDRYGVISAQCAAAMARNTRELLETDYCVSFTGNAGPSAMEGKPAGDIFCAIDSKNEDTQVWNGILSLPRNELRKEAVRQMLEALLECMKHDASAQNLHA